MKNLGNGKIVALVGIGLILVGMFLPYWLLPFLGSVSIVGMIEVLPEIGEAGSMLVLVATVPLPALVAIALVLTDRVNLCWIPGVVCSFGIVFPFVHLSTNFGRSMFKFDHFVELVLEGGRYGGFVLAAGILCLMLAPTVARKQSTATGTDSLNGE